MDSLIQTVGGVATGERFWDREEEMALLAQLLDEGAHLLLTAQRRMGKTSLLREASNRLKDRYLCLYVDLQKAKDSPDVIVALSLELYRHTSLWEKTKTVFANIMGRLTGTVEKVELGELAVTLRDGVTSGDWSVKGDRLFEILAGSALPVVLMLDEFPMVVSRILKDEDSAITSQGIAQVDAFMSWIRENSIKHQGHVRIVISGSIGLEPILHQARLSATINTFTPFDLKPWSPPIAVGALQALGRQYGVEFLAGADLQVVRRLGCCVPHHVQTFFSRIQEWCKANKCAKVSITQVDEIYESEMLGVRGHAELTTYEDRLRLVLGGEVLAMAMELLTEAAVTRRLTRKAVLAVQKDYAFPSCTVEEAQKSVLEILQHDGYLRRDSHDYVFVSMLLRDWWEVRHGCFYTPILKRS